MCLHVVVAIGYSLPEFVDGFGHDGNWINSCHHILKIAIMWWCIMYDLIYNCLKLGTVFLQVVGGVKCWLQSFH